MKKSYKPYKKGNYQKKPYSNPYKSGSSYYAFHDIFEHEEEIKHNIIMEHVRDYRYVISNQNIKIGRVNAPGYPDGKRLRIYKVPGCGPIDGVTMIIDNSENFVNEFGIAMNPNEAKDLGYDWSYDIVQVEVGGTF